MSGNDRPAKTWNELHSNVQSYRRKLSKLSTKVPANFTFRQISASLTRLYFLSVPKGGKETTLLYIDIPQQLTESDEQSGDELTWNPLLESSFQASHQVKQYSKEEQLLRERKRQVTWGMTSYELDVDSGTFVFPICGSLFTCIDDGKSPPYFAKELKNDANCSGTKLNSQICTYDPQLVSFVRNHDLWIQHTETGVETRLTFAHKGSKNLTDDPLSAGVPSYIILEEFGRYTGHWWQPVPSVHEDDTNIYRILYEETDDSYVDILHFPVASEDGTVEEFRFPRAGTPNSKSSLKIVQFQLSPNGQAIEVTNLILHEPLGMLYPWVEYIVRIGWTPDGKYVWAVLLNRLQTFLQLVLFPLSAFVPASIISCDDNFDGRSFPASEIIYEERNSAWLNIHDNLHFLPNTDNSSEITFIWASEETGFRHLYLVTACISASSRTTASTDRIEYGYVGPVIKKKIALTTGDWEVLPRNLWVDEEKRLVYFLALRDDPLEKHLYVVCLDEPLNVIQLTQPGFSHCVHVDVQCNMFVTVMSNTTTRPSSHVYTIDHAQPNTGLESIRVKSICTLLQSHDVEDDQLHPEIFKYKISSGHSLYGMMFKPNNMSPNKKYPTVLVVYGGPEVQLISNTYKGLRQLRQRMLAAEGYIVISIDSRGSTHRGVEFETHIKNRMGTVEIADQVEVLESLANDNPFIDLNRVAIHGWSYGGYLSLMGLAQRPDIFKVAVAGAPVTSWTLYDTGYTERYIGLPSTNPHSYKAGSVLSYVSQFPDQENRLLILHGLIDENVHFSHTSQLINSLLKAHKPYQLQVYPNERHSLRHVEASEHFETTLLSFLNQWL